MTVDLFNTQPLYRQLYNSLKDDIEKGRYEPSGRLPIESELSKIHKVSRITVRQAVSMLVTEKLVYRRQGRGTFVATPKDSHVFNKLKTIAFLAGYPKDTMDSSYEIMPKIIHEAEEEGYKKGYRLSIFNMQNGLQKSRERIKMISRGGIDGIVFWPILDSSGDMTNRRIMDSLILLRVPIVLFDRFLDGYNLDYVVSDNEQGSYQLISHLIENGHSRIAVISDPECSSIRNRIAGYKRAIREAGIEFDPQLIRINENQGSDEQTAEQVDALVKMKTPPTAIFATYDNLAMTAMDTLKRMGLSVPDDLAVVGYDNRRFASSLSLTTMDEPCGEMARKAIKRVCQKIENKDEEIKKIIVKSRLIVRSSSGRLSVPHPVGQ